MQHFEAVNHVEFLSLRMSPHGQITIEEFATWKPVLEMRHELFTDVHSSVSRTRKILLPHPGKEPLPATRIQNVHSRVHVHAHLPKRLHQRLPLTFIEI